MNIDNGLACSWKWPETRRTRFWPRRAGISPKTILSGPTNWNGINLAKCAVTRHIQTETRPLISRQTADQYYIPLASGLNAVARQLQGISPKHCARSAGLRLLAMFNLQKFMS